jgi:hypothetical protein
MSGTQSLTPDNLLGYGIPTFSNFVTAVDRELNKTKVSVFPNPVGTLCFLQFSSAIQDNAIQCSIFDSRGVSIQLLAIKEDDFRFSLDLTTCKPGLYVLRIQRGSDVYTHKIIRSGR